MAVKLTNAVISKFKYDADGSKIQRLWDTTVSGLGVEVFKTGRKSWIYRYRINGKQRFTTLGQVAEYSIDEAQALCVLMRGDIRRGNDPQQAREQEQVESVRQAMTLDDLFDAYTATPHYDQTSRDFKVGIKGTYTRYLQPTLGQTPLNQIKRASLKEIGDGLIAEGKSGACRGFINRANILFNWGIQNEHLESIPAYKLSFKYSTSGKRETWLKTDEAVSKAWYFKGDPQVRALVRWMLLTGCRRDEGRTATWSQVEDGVWRVEDTKNKTTLALPITDEMQAVLTDMKNTYDSEFIFPATTSNRKSIPRGSLHYLLKKHGDFTPHELRHTVATLCDDIGGIEETDVSRILNHSFREGSATTKTYSHSEKLPAKRATLEIWHRELARIARLTF